MKKQKVLSLVLAAALCVSMPAPAMAAEFTSGEEENAVEFAAEDEFTDSAEALEDETAENNGDDESSYEYDDFQWVTSIKDVLLDTQYTDVVTTDLADTAYKFTLDSAGWFNIKGTFSEVIGIDLTIYDSSRKKVCEGDYFDRDKDSKQGFFDYSIALTKGTYYVVISGNCLVDATGECSFTLSSDDIEETIPEEQGGSNNKSADADEISLNETYKGLLTYNDTVDWYKFTLSKDASIKITIDIKKLMDGVLYKKENGKLILVEEEKYPFESEGELKAGEYYLCLKFLAKPESYEFKVNAHLHKWKYQNTPASLKTDGLNFYTCSCGKTKVGKTIYRPKTISLSKTKYTYDGHAHKPKVEVKDRKGNVISPSNYKVTYSKGLTKKGTYTVKITFKGKYSGSVKKQFKIV